VGRDHHKNQAPKFFTFLFVLSFDDFICFYYFDFRKTSNVLFETFWDPFCKLIFVNSLVEFHASSAEVPDN